MTQASRAQNRLANETSPYLLSHSSNPVDWYPWGPEALERARAEDRPLLVSIGYSACHWCHVMEKESFENEHIARLMNESFVCIKVDREERPDLDAIYMEATTLLNHGQGGWPMTVFLTPDQKPFFAGTYFPPTTKYGRPGFDAVLSALADAWNTNRKRVLTAADELTSVLRREGRGASRDDALQIAQSAIDRAVERLRAEFDPDEGGFGGAPKFPPTAALGLLLRVFHHTGDAHTLAMVTTTLTKMARGGIYDQLAGGFMRYSTDERWLVPHFEKMLYDNALLSRVYLEAFQVTREPLYARVARETLDYVLREMTSPEGGFYSATDADSEGEEGKFFVWTPDEVREVLDARSHELFSAYYDVTELGNWEGKSILNVPRSLEEVANDVGVTSEELSRVVAAAREALYAARQQRVPPALDDKVLTSWNALMITSLATGQRVLGEERYGAAARRAAGFLMERLADSATGQLFRTYRAGVAHLAAYLEDHAFLAAALIDLYEADFEPAHLERARGLVETLLLDFRDEESGAFFTTSNHHEVLIVRPRENQDGALPSANAVAAEALARLSFHLDEPAWRHAAERALNAHAVLMERAPRAFCRSFGVADFLQRGPLELSVVGNPEERRALLLAVNRQYLPNRVIAAADNAASPLPLLRDKPPIGGRAALYICRDRTCEPPITAPEEIARALFAGPGSRAAAAESS